MNVAITVANRLPQTGHIVPCLSGAARALAAIMIPYTPSWVKASILKVCCYEDGAYAVELALNYEGRSIL